MNQPAAFQSNVPYILVENAIVVAVSEGFCCLTSYQSTELLNQPFHDTLNTLLRVSLKLENIKHEQEAILFSKSREVIQVKIIKEYLPTEASSLYYFKEMPVPKFEDKNQFVQKLMEENIIGIGVYTAPDFQLIKANQVYLDYLPKPNNTKEMAYGKYLYDLIPSFKGTNGDQSWKDMLITKQSLYLKEKKTYLFGTSDNYWDNTVVPIVEDGEVKYIVSMLEDVTERVLSREHIKRQSDTIKLQNKQLEAIIDNISDILAIVDEKGRIKKLNKAARELAPTLNSNQKSCWREEVRYFDDEGKEIHFNDTPLTCLPEGKFVNKKRFSIRYREMNWYYDVTTTPIYDDNNCIVAGIINGHDITENVLQSEHLARQNKELETIIDHISDGLAVVDKYGTFIKVNTEAKKILGSKIQVGENLAGVCGSNGQDQLYLKENGELLPLHEMPSYKVLQGQRVHKQRIIIKQGAEERHFDFSAIPVFDDNNELQYGIITTHDITQMVEKDKLIHQQKNHLQNITDNMTDALFIMNPDESYSYLNQRAFDMVFDSHTIKTHGDSLKHTRYFDLDGKELTKAGLPGSKVLKGEVVENTILKVVRPDKCAFYSFNGKPIYDENGIMIYALLCLRDVTDYMAKQFELEEIQLQLLKAEIEKREALENAMKLKDEFLYMITHEFKTPLAVINSALQTMNLVCKQQIPSKANMFLDTIRQNTNRQLRLVNNLLDITKLNAGQIKLHKSMFDIVFVTQSIVHSVQIYAEQKDIKVSFLTCLSSKKIVIDEEKFERILLNLLSNALKFTPSGGLISVLLTTKKNQDKEMVAVTVSDNGIGIPLDKQQHIFERFGQADTSLSRQAEGTGIGLYLVKLLVHALNGHILLESEEGIGSQFTVLLPEGDSDELQTSCTSIEGLQKTSINDSRLIEAAAIEFSDIYF